MATGRLIFVAGTDTGVGKTVACGLLARAYRKLGLKVITAKPVQTGAREPEDLLLHRRLMDLPPDPPELLSLTCPYLFSYPAAPITAAAREGKKVDLKVLLESLKALLFRYEMVLVEGAGGLYVPYTEEATFLDLIQYFMAPVVVVSAARLGTINHTLLTLEALRSRGLVVPALFYNRFFETEPYLASESLREIQRRAGPLAVFEMPSLSEKNLVEITEALKEFLKETPGLRP
ncbi:dethiobiotin synthase [Thermosulfurimonas marina]|uniref:ATP-dependent dethiobiotin synthetase BioD n=1 Tax=Thermosulfurimonas marina TaxID=2047767 RepID=A0A6H1WQL4_9BACT|nr:dethiobiotin synthase [Thermosulfurimonas marina]QJA05449.1 dethiobiotin synthase [Thermosulfurimonas marina]